MSKYHGIHARIALDELHLSCYADSYDATLGVDMADVSVLCDLGHKYIPGLNNDTLSATGHFDATADAVVEPQRGASGLSLVTFGPGGLDVGQFTYHGSVRQSSYATSASVTDRVTFAVNLNVDGSLLPGVSLHPPEAETATGNGTSVDNGASSAGGVSASIHASDVTGTLDVKIQDSANNADWADLVTFAQLSAAGFELGAAAGTVDRYLRAVWTIGTGPATFTVAVARL
jgi:hypothetical protein